jgi:hypothetical protein
MSEQKPSHEVEGIVRRALRQDSILAQIWGRVPKMSAVLKVPKNTVAREVTKNPVVTLTELQGSSVEMGECSRRTTISAAFHQSAFMVEWLDGSHSSVKGTWQHLKDS